MAAHRKSDSTPRLSLRGADSVSVHFLRDKIEESRLKCLWQQTAGTHRCGEAVSWSAVLIHVHRARLSPRESWPSQLVALRSARRIECCDPYR